MTFHVFAMYLFMSFTGVLTGLFVFVLLSFERSLYSLDTSPLLDIWFVNILSYSVAYLFTLLRGSFVEPKFVILTKSNLLIQICVPF